MVVQASREELTTRGVDALTAPGVDALVHTARKQLQATGTAERVEVRDGKVPGLVLSIRPSGTASWTLRYRRSKNGESKLTTYTIGRHGEPVQVERLIDGKPETLAVTLTLAVAREIAGRIRSGVHAGADPTRERQLARHREGVVTVEDLTRKWLDSREARSWRPTTEASYRIAIDKRIVPTLGTLGLADVTKADVRRLLEKIHETAPISSNRTFEIIRQMFNWARTQDYVAVNPCDAITKLTKERERERRYGDDELRAIVAAVRGTGIEDLTNLILLVATRSHETRAMRWSQIDFDRKVWTIPADDAKSGREHVVPLSPTAWRIIESRHRKHGRGEFVFPRQTDECGTCGAKGHAGAPTNRLLRAVAKKAGLIRNVGTKDKPEWKGEALRLHDLRRSVADRMLNELKVAPYVVDMGVLAHAVPKLLRTYMPSGIALTEVASALHAWDARLDQILSGERRRADVRSISRGRRRG